MLDDGVSEVVVGMRLDQLALFVGDELGIWGTPSFGKIGRKLDILCFHFHVSFDHSTVPVCFILQRCLEHTKVMSSG